MHRLSKKNYNNDLDFKDIFNTYCKKFFSEFAYFSESRMCCENDAESISTNGQTKKVQRLIHPLWHSELESNMKDVLGKFVKKKKEVLFYNIDSNITNLNEIIQKEELIR